MDNLAGPDMIIDGFEQFNHQENEEVHNISPDEEPAENVLRADNYDEMKEHVLVDKEGLETLDETCNTWHIEKWRNLTRKEHGPTFQCGGSPWRVLFFPFGNQVDSASFYLEHGYENEPPEDWYACVQFALVLWNPNDPTLYKVHTAQHRFNAKEGDWGFTRFVELRKAFHLPWEDGNRTLVEKDEAMLTAYVRVLKDPTGVLWHNFEGYDSKKVTGMVGLKNQGATCYLNSLLQSLYFTNAFRKAVYQIPTETETTRLNSAWTLQRLFYRLQKDKQAVSTNELTASFGWDRGQIFEQQDVTELSRILMEVLEKKMKDTPAEKTLPDLFIGKMKTYISCINVKYESSRIEDYWDLQLNVRGNKNVDESFKDYIQVETLEGENKYDAGDPHGLQDAKKGVIFESFPPVLHLQLKRFEYDVMKDAMTKINDRHEFPEEFDATPYMSEEAKASTTEPWTYALHGVLVHSGDFNAGHYYAFLKPTPNGDFYKFDDDRVTRATMREVLEENYGGEYATAANGGLGHRQPYMRGYSTKRSMNAYMLVYIRKSRVDQVFNDVGEGDIPSHIESRITEEQEELARKKKERQEAHLYLHAGVLSEKTFQAHKTFDLTTYEADQDPSTPKIHRVLKSAKVEDFAATIAEELGVDGDQVRFWSMVGRQNKTNRPDTPIRENDITMEEAMSKYGPRGRQFYLWAEIGPRAADGQVFFPESTSPNGNNPILVFLKYFDVRNQTLSGVGHVYVRKHDKVSDIAPQINQLMEWDSSTPLLLFEEIKSSMIEAMKPKQTFQQSEIQDGDIICFQQNFSESEQLSVAYTDARQYYDFLLNRTDILFAPRPGLDGEQFTLTLSKKMTYDQFSAKVAEHLGVDPTHMRYATVHATTGKPKAFVKRNLNQNLSQVLHAQYSSYGGYATHCSDRLYYEVLETSLADFETKRPIKVYWLSEGINKEELLEVLVPKSGTIGDLIHGLARKVNLDEAAARLVRVFEVHAAKIHKELAEDFNLVSINEFTTLYAETVPDEEIHASEGDRTIYCFHFDKEPNKAHGIPFKFVLVQGEKTSEMRERISKRTGIKGKLLANIKFALVPRGQFQKPRYLEDDDVPADIIGETSVEGMSEEMLGLDHVSKQRTSLWGRAEGMFIR